MKTHSRATLQAIRLLGGMIRVRRLESRMTSEDLAARVGISRALLFRIEKGDPACSIGSAFEAAAVLGIPLFDNGEGGSIAAHLAQQEKTLSLLPAAARPVGRSVRDDF